MGKSASFYAVRTGRKPGVYNSWPECEEQVKGISRTRFQRFDTLKEALEFVNGVDPPSFKKPYDKTDKSSKKRTELKIPVSSGLASVSEFLKNEFKEIVYTDGSSRGNGKRGARAGVGVFFGDNDPRNYSEPLKGSEQTNNRAELTAGIQAIKLSSPEKILEIKTDSRYLIQGVTSWMPNWKKKDWKTSTGTDVKNRDLFEELHNEIQKRKRPITWTHVSAHTGIYGNEMADYLANLGADRFSSLNKN